jgi:hypothetical protein
LEHMVSMSSTRPKIRRKPIPEFLLSSSSSSVGQSKRLSPDYDYCVVRIKHGGSVIEFRIDHKQTKVPNQRRPQGTGPKASRMPFNRNHTAPSVPPALKGCRRRGLPQASLFTCTSQQERKAQNPNSELSATNATFERRQKDNSG